MSRIGRGDKKGNVDRGHGRGMTTVCLVGTQECMGNLGSENWIKKFRAGMRGWLSSLAPAFGPGRDPGVPGSGPHRAPCMEPAPPSASLSLSLSFMNK